jgi:hypothetical protein
LLVAPLLEAVAPDADKIAFGERVNLNFAHQEPDFARRRAADP